MDNLIYGIEAIGRGINSTISTVLKLQLFWGFALGFLVATIVYAFIVSENPKHIPALMISKKTQSFRKIYMPDKNGVYSKSFVEFARMVDKIKLLFTIAFLFCIGIIFVSLIRF